MYSKINNNPNSAEFDGFCTIENLRKLDVPCNIDWSKKVEITENMYTICVGWMIEVGMMYKFNPNTLFLSIRLFGLVITSKDNIPKSNLQLYGIVCMMLASKQHEMYPREVADFVFICDNHYTSEQMLDTEIEVFNLLNGRINYPTFIDYARIFSYKSGFTSEEHNRAKALSVVCCHISRLSTFDTETNALAINWMVSSRSEKLWAGAELTPEIKYAVEQNENYCSRMLRSPKLLDVVDRYIAKSKCGCKTLAEIMVNRKDVFGLYPLVIQEKKERHVSITIISEKQATIKTLGEGAYGVVKQVKVGEKVCVLKKSRNMGENGLTQGFIRELGVYHSIAVLGMQGEYTVDCLGYFVDRDKEYLYLENASFGCLKDFVETHPSFFSSPKSSIKATTELFRGLGFLHSLGIMHRDIKPQNILVFGHVDDIKLKYCDFGIARGSGVVIADGNAFTDVVCTLWYRPVEVLCKKRGGRVTYGPSIDVWSLSCVIHEMIMPLRKGGRKGVMSALFPGDSEFDMVSRINSSLGMPERMMKDYEMIDGLEDHSKKPGDIFPGNLFPEILKEVILKGLKVDPYERISAGEAYELLLNAPRDPMIIENLTPPRK